MYKTKYPHLAQPLKLGHSGNYSEEQNKQCSSVELHGYLR